MTFRLVGRRPFSGDACGPASPRRRSFIEWPFPESEVITIYDASVREVTRDRRFGIELV